MTRRPDLHDMLTGRHYGTMGDDWIADQIRRAEGDTTVDRIRPDEAARLAEYHAPREPMPAWAGWVWIALIVGSVAVWVLILRAVL